MKTLEELQKSQNSLLILHYACTDINNSPVIITSISTKNYATGQTSSFSYDEFGEEEKLLSAFVNHMKNYQNYTIVTWNQKSSTYGIQYIQRRCKELGVTNDFPIHMEQLVDLDDIYTEKYGRGYVKDPKLRCLADLNNIPLINFVEGKDEIDLFYKKEYKKIENSTNKKVSVIADYLTASFKNKLKVSKGDKSKHKLTTVWKVIVAVGVIIGIIVSVIELYKWVVR